VTRIVLALVLAAGAAGVAALLRSRRGASAPVEQGARWPVPVQVDRADFPRSDAPWLVIVFSSATCESCARTVAAAAVLECAEVAVHVCEAVADRDLHRRYHIEAVPITVVVDGAGVVRASFVGPPTATDLWAAVAEVREPGSTPGGGCER